MNWIPCSERLPDCNVPVVGFHSAQLVPVVCFLTNYYGCIKRWNLVSACFYTDPMGQLKTVSGRITHWMPIPKITK